MQSMNPNPSTKPDLTPPASTAPANPFLILEEMLAQTETALQDKLNSSPSIIDLGRIVLSLQRLVKARVDLAKTQALLFPGSTSGNILDSPSPKLTARIQAIPAKIPQSANTQNPLNTPKSSASSIAGKRPVDPSKVKERNLKTLKGIIHQAESIAKMQQRFSTPATSLTTSIDRLKEHLEKYSESSICSESPNPLHDDESLRPKTALNQLDTGLSPSFFSAQQKKMALPSVVKEHSPSAETPAYAVK